MSKKREKKEKKKNKKEKEQKAMKQRENTHAPFCAANTDFTLATAAAAAEAEEEVRLETVEATVVFFVSILAVSCGSGKRGRMGLLVSSASLSN